MEYSQDPGVEAQAETTANNNAMGEITVELLYYQRCGGCMHVGTLPPDGNWMGNSELPGISFEQLPKPVQEKG